MGARESCLRKAITDLFLDHSVSRRGQTPTPPRLVKTHHAFDLGVLGELGASRFLGPKWVRAKDAKDAKVRKVITDLSLFHMGIDHE